MSRQKPKAMRSASCRQYFAEGLEVQALCGGIHEWRKAK